MKSWKDRVDEAMREGGLHYWKEVASLLGVRQATVSDWKRGVAVAEPHMQELYLRHIRTATRLTAGQPLGGAPDAPPPPAGDPASPGILPLAIPQHFASESDRISFARGVLLMGAETNRITSESSHQVARAIQAAMAALLAPVGVTPTEIPAPTGTRPPGQKARILDALATLEAADAAPAQPRRRKAR